jgi:FkbM family methyltransferase
MSAGKTKVLIHFTHGLGDAVQLTCVLQHLRKYRPDWELYLQALRGKHSAGYGHCRRVWHDQEPQPDHAFFDRVFRLGWYENYNGYPDCPNTKVTNCLREVFGIQPDPALLRYRLHVGEEVVRATGRYLEGIGCQQLPGGRYNAAAIHYQGNTSTGKKNLTHEEASALCEVVIDAGQVPVVLDWDRRSPLPDGRRVFNPGVHPDDVWGGFGSGDAERIAALVGQCSLFVGIDSGPQKCAGATDTPAIGVWKSHSPVQFMDLCDNFTHLVPDDFHRTPPCQNRAVAAYFVNHYRFRTYGPGGLVPALNDLALEMLGQGPQEGKPGLVRLAGFWVPVFRPEQSWVIVEDVYLNDAYKTHLRPRKRGPEYVVDLGANVGCFARLWHERNPQAQVVCVEVCPELIPALTANVGAYAAVEQAACHYGEGDLFLLSTFTEEGRSTGGSRVVTGAELEGERDPQYRKVRTPLRKVTLEEIMAAHRLPRIDVLKLDVEGSEYSILEHAPLDRVGTIFLESHGAERFRDLLRRKFTGWDVGHMSRSGEGGNFENWHLVNPNFPG